MKKFKNKLISIRYFTINQNKLKEHQFVGVCYNKKKKRIFFKSKIKKETIKFSLNILSPIVLKTVILRKFI